MKAWGFHGTGRPSVRQEKAEESVQPVADAEGICLVVEAGDILDFDTAKGPPDGRIIALRDKVPAEISVFFQRSAEYGRKGQKTLINIIIVELLFHIRIEGKVDGLQERIKQHMVFRQTFFVHIVCE